MLFCFLHQRTSVPAVDEERILTSHEAQARHLPFEVICTPGAQKNEFIHLGQSNPAIALVKHDLKLFKKTFAAEEVKGKEVHNTDLHLFAEL